MKLSTTARAVLGIIALAGAYRMYQIYKIGTSIAYSVKGVKFRKIDKRYAVVVSYDIFNPTSSKLNIRKVTGKLYSFGALASTFSSDSFTLNPGHNTVPINFYLNAAGVVKTIVDSITQKKYPVFQVHTITHLALFKYGDTFAINTADYAAELKSIIFQPV